MNPKDAPARRIVLKNDSSTVTLNCLFGDCQAETSAAVRARAPFIDAKESLENLVMIFALDAGAVVLHRDVDLVPTAYCGDSNLRIGWTMLDRVVDEIHHSQMH